MYIAKIYDQNFMHKMHEFFCENIGDINTNFITKLNKIYDIEDIIKFKKNIYKINAIRNYTDNDIEIRNKVLNTYYIIYKKI